jgi:hypothetical protein
MIFETFTPHLVTHHFDIAQMSSLVPPNRQLVVIFDQAERFFTMSSSGDESAQAIQTWLIEFLRTVGPFSNISVVLSIRKEYYFDIVMLLTEVAEVSYVTAPVYGIQVSTSDPAGRALHAALRSVTTSDDTVTTILAALSRDDARVLPIQAQIVGLALENLDMTHRGWDRGLYRK